MGSPRSSVVRPALVAAASEPSQIAGEPGSGIMVVVEPPKPPGADRFTVPPTRLPPVPFTGQLGPLQSTLPTMLLAVEIFPLTILFWYVDVPTSEIPPP